MKKIIMVLTTLTLFLTLSGFCFVHDWQPAGCTTPSRCAKCDKTKGVARGHDYGPINCNSVVTCTHCGKEEKQKWYSGEKPGHKWEDATCTAPQTCSGCGETFGTAKGHIFRKSDCITKGECAVCGIEDSRYGPHDFGDWVKSENTMSRQCSICQKETTQALDWKEYARQLLNGKWVGVSGNTFTGSGNLEDTYFTVMESGRVTGKLQGKGFNFDSVKYLRTNKNDSGDISSIEFGFGKTGYYGHQEIIYFIQGDNITARFSNGFGHYEREAK